MDCAPDAGRAMHHAAVDDAGGMVMALHVVGRSCGRELGRRRDAPTCARDAVGDRVRGREPVFVEAVTQAMRRRTTCGARPAGARSAAAPRPPRRSTHRMRVLEFVDQRVAAAARTAG